MLRLCLAAAVMLATFPLLPTPSSANEDGATIWADDYVGTVRAMKQVSRAIGVKSCLYCHVKEDGRINYKIETAHKEVARQMKLVVDNLAAKGTGEVSIDEEDKRVVISAVYTATGDDAGIHLTVVQTPKDTKIAPTTSRKTLSLPDGPLNCGTCHNRKLHFVTE